MIIEIDIPSPVTAKELNIFVRALCAYNVSWLRQHPDTPDLYASGVRYSRQSGIERFLSIPRVLAQGDGDCDQLAPWRAAELRVRRGIKALPEVKRMEANLFHVFVRLPGGRVEDPSAHLGMSIPRRLVEAGRRVLAKQGTRRNGLFAHPRIAAPAWSAWAQ